MRLLSCSTVIALGCSLALLLGRPIASHRLRSSCRLAGTPSDHVPPIMEDCHRSQLLSGADAGPSSRFLLLYRHSCACMSTASGCMHARQSMASQWVARRGTSEARTAGHGGQDLVAMTAFIRLWSLCASTGAQKLSSCPACKAWHPRIMTLRSVCGLMTRRYADCMLAARFQYPTDASFQVHAGLHFCGIAPWVCQHRTAALPVELTSDSYMAGIRSWPLSFRLLGSKSACIVARRHHTIEGRVAHAIDYLGHADAYKFGEHTDLITSTTSNT